MPTISPNPENSEPPYNILAPKPPFHPPEKSFLENLPRTDTAVRLTGPIALLIFDRMTQKPFNPSFLAINIYSQLQNNSQMKGLISPEELSNLITYAAEEYQKQRGELGVRVDNEIKPNFAQQEYLPPVNQPNSEPGLPYIRLLAFTLVALGIFLSITGIIVEIQKGQPKTSQDKFPTSQRQPSVIENPPTPSKTPIPTPTPPPTENAIPTATLPRITPTSQFQSPEYLNSFFLTVPPGQTPAEAYAELTNNKKIGSDSLEGDRASYWYSGANCNKKGRGQIVFVHRSLIQDANGNPAYLYVVSCR